MPEYSAAARERMRQQQQRFKEGRGSGKHVSLSGQNAIVEPGQTVIVRILPRWDFALKAFMQGPRGNWVKNPDYQPEEAYAAGIEHWFTGPDGKRKREWCRRSLDPDELCPICEFAAAHEGSSDDNERQAGFDMAGKDVVLYNVILRSRPFGEDGKPAIKILTVTPTLWLSINREAAGQDESFSIGDYTDPETGYDWKIYRPAARKAGVKQESYSAEHASKPSRLYAEADAARWRGWHAMLHDLDAEIRNNVKSYEELYRMVYGTDPPVEQPDAGFEGSAEFPPETPEAAGAEFAPETPAAEAAPETDAAAPGGPGADFDYPPMGTSEPVSPAAPPRTAAPARTAVPPRPAAPPAPAAPAPARRAAPPLRPGPGRRR